MPDQNQVPSKPSTALQNIETEKAQWVSSIRSLEKQLTPATPSEIAEALAILFAQFPSAASGDADLRTEGYLYALQGICPSALKMAVGSLLNGDELDWDGRFMPTAPQFAKICRRMQGYDERALRRLRNDYEQRFGQGYYLESWMERSDGPRSIGEIVGQLLGARRSGRQENETP